MHEKPKHTKPRWNLWQNTCFMLRTSKEAGAPGIPLACAGIVVFSVLQSLAELCIAPTILEKVETAAPLSVLLGTIAAFAVLLTLLSGVKNYLLSSGSCARLLPRMQLVFKVNRKALTTSFPHTEDKAFLEQQEKTFNSVGSDNHTAQAIWGELTTFVTNVVSFVVWLAMLAQIDVRLLGIILVTSAAGYFANRRICEWHYRHRDEEAEYAQTLGYVRSKAQDRRLGKDIRIFGMRPWLEEMHDSAQRLMDDFQNRAQRVYLWADVLDLSLAFLRNGAAYLYLIALTVEQGWPASLFLLCFTAAGNFAGYVTGILSGLNTLRRQSLDLCVLREFLEKKELFRFEEGRALQWERAKPCTLTLENVSFRYPGAQADTLHGINLTLHPGEKLAIVGLNGAGKTTLIRLLCGFYDPTEGRVLLEGEDIRQYNRRDYYRLFAAVFQQFSVLDVTLADNISQGTDNMDEEKLDRVIHGAGLAPLVEKLPRGKDTHIGRTVWEDGVELSGGETQRLMLARALYKDAPILLLDEPTAALDPLAEHDIYCRYNEMTKGRSAVFISHRLASTRFCDRILFLEDGGIAEEGTHEELLRMNGTYAALYQVQAQYYQQGGAENG